MISGQFTGILGHFSGICGPFRVNLRGGHFTAILGLVSLRLFAANFQKPGELQRMNPPPMFENKNRPEAPAPPQGLESPRSNMAAN